MNAQEILELLAQPEGGRECFRRIKREAQVCDLIAALRLSQTAHARQLLCDLLGYRKAKTAATLLLDCLQDSSEHVRCSTAEALARIGDPSTGDRLLEHLLSETSEPVRENLAMALGAVGYRPAIPTLVGLLTAPEATLRGVAAWSLAALGALEYSTALRAMRRARRRETDSYALTRMRVALGEEQEIGAAPDFDPETALPRLSPENEH